MTYTHINNEYYMQMLCTLIYTFKYPEINHFNFLIYFLGQWRHQIHDVHGLSTKKLTTQ